MSNTAKEETEAKEEEGGTADKNVCVNCGIAAVDIIKLEECTDCDLVKYCSDKCREEHREQHEEHCKKRKAELHDKELFTQPDETHLGECPLCFLPMPIDPRKFAFYSCCSEIICKGCVYANYKSNGYDEMKARSCPFCREPRPEKGGEHKRMMKRIKAKDPAALNQMGGKFHIEGDYNGALEYYTKAAELGNAFAHYTLGNMYGEGEGVEKDEEKEVYHFERAAICGHPTARYNLGCHEGINGRVERAVKHFMIAANHGHEESMKALWAEFKDGYITKEDLDATLRTHQAAINAMKSLQREEAERLLKYDIKG
jgi:tetratricopeptide (TPR) repeat protein